MLPILHLGRLASSCLASGSRGTVLASTSRAIFLLSGGQELLWLADGRSSMHWRCAQVSGLLPRATPQADYVVVGRQLDIGGQAAFDLAGASLWPPALARRPVAVPLGRMASQLLGAVSRLIHRHPPVGLGVLVPRLADLGGHRLLGEPVGEPSPAADRAWPAIRDLYHACSAWDMPAVLKQADALVGLGEGLTPSGDDLLGGLLYSLARLREAFPAFRPAAACALGEFLLAARSRTNVISHSLLADHARGLASEALARFTQALLAGQGPERVCVPGALLIQVGHSTGWDLLTGVTLGILATASGDKSRRPVEDQSVRLLRH